MNSNFKPLLAVEADLAKLRFPLLASAKLDGIRAIVFDKKVYSRNLKLIPNLHVQKLFGNKDNEGLDGELIVGEPNSKTVYRDTMSGVMSVDGTPNVRFFAFDTVGPLPYHMRQPQRERPHVVNLNQYEVFNMEGLLSLEQNLLDQGYEGLILRSHNGPYKYGRSTVKEGYLLKLKRFSDSEALVIGFEERMYNGNEATVDELGRTKRSSHKAGKTGRGDLGALICRTIEGIEFSIGTGFDDDQRREIWLNRDEYLNKLAKFKHFVIGAKDAPRFPVFVGWRAEIDK